MSWVYQNGIWFHIKGGSADDARPYMHRAELDLKKLKLRSAGLDVMFYEREGMWQVSSIWGRDVIRIDLETVLRIEEEEEESIQLMGSEELPSSPSPVLGFSLGSLELGGQWGSPAFFSGVYCNDSMQWDNPKYFMASEPDVPMYAVDPSREQSLNSTFTDEQGNQIELYVLPGYNNDAAWDYEDIEIESQLKFGANETWWNPYDYVFGTANKRGGNWEYSSFIYEWKPPPEEPVKIIVLKHIPSGKLYKLKYGVGCMGDTWLLVYTNDWPGFFHCHAPLKEDGEDKYRTWPPDGVQHIHYRKTIDVTGTTEIEGQIIEEYSGHQDKYVYSQGYVGPGYPVECASFTKIDNHFEDIATRAIQSCYVAPNIWIVMYVRIHRIHDDQRRDHPWIFFPYDHDMGPAPETWIHVRHMIAYRDGGGMKKYEYAEESFGDYLPVTEWQCAIYDFHGTPILLFTWWDDRDGCMHYGAIYKGQIIESKPYPAPGPPNASYPPLHPVGNSTSFGAQAWGIGVACGMRRIKSSPIYLTGDY